MLTSWNQRMWRTVMLSARLSRVLNAHNSPQSMVSVLFFILVVVLAGWVVDVLAHAFLRICSAILQVL